MTVSDILVMISIAVVVFVIWRSLIHNPFEDVLGESLKERNRIREEQEEFENLCEKLYNADWGKGHPSHTFLSTKMHRDQLKEYSDSYFDGMTEAIHAYNFYDALYATSGTVGSLSNHEYSKFVGENRRCVYCRTLNPADHRSCDKCGAPL